MSTAVSEADLKHPRSVSAFRVVKVLIGIYAVLSVLTIGVAVLFRNDPTLVNDTVWTRGGILAVVSLLTYAFTVSASRGSRRAFLRIRIISALQVVAIAVIVSLPGLIPLWMRGEQVLCGLVLLGVVILVNGKHLRSVFASRRELA
jgi:hypothetical protein